MTHKFSPVDVFTAEPHRGNPVAVVHGAGGSSDAPIARALMVLVLILTACSPAQETVDPVREPTAPAVTQTARVFPDQTASPVPTPAPGPTEEPVDASAGYGAADIYVPLRSDLTLVDPEECKPALPVEDEAIAEARRVSVEGPPEGSLYGAFLADHALLGEVVGFGGPEVVFDNGFARWDPATTELPSVVFRIDANVASWRGEPLSSDLVGTEAEIQHSSSVLEAGRQYMLFVSGSGNAFYYAHDVACDLPAPGLAGERSLAALDALADRFPTRPEDTFQPGLAALLQWLQQPR